MTSDQRIGEIGDVEVLRAIAGGDVHGIGVLYDRHAPALFAVALRIVRDRTEAEDVLHDAFVLVSERASQYVPERGSVVAWLVTVVRNLSVDRVRRRKRRSAIAEHVIAHEPRACVADPEAVADGSRESERMRRALETLDDTQRRTLEVAFFEGLSYPEIAAREGVPLGTIKSRAARALTALREALASVPARRPRPRLRCSCARFVSAA